MKLLVVDDHPLILEALAMYVAEAEPGWTLLTALSLVAIPLVLLIVRRPGLTSAAGGKALAFVAFFLLYSPVYLAARGMVLVGKGGWVDRQELRFYGACFIMLCSLVVIAILSPVAAAAVFVLIAGSAHLLWRAFI